MKVATLSLLILSASASYADVNMLNASYRTDFIDLQINGLKIQRRYDSRSNFQGLFGFGWCSTFDTRLEFSGHGVRVRECGKLSRLGAVRFVHGTYVQNAANGLVRSFSADTGELTALQAPGNGVVSVTRTRLPRAAALGEGMKMRRPASDPPAPHETGQAAMLDLEFDDLGENVTSITTSEQRLEFRYSPTRDLIEARNAWSNTYRYDYDTLHNMTQALYPDGTSERMIYDQDKDQLLKFEGRDGCSETYDYVTTPLHQTSKAKLTCKGEVKRTARFEFGFSKQGQLTSFEVKK